MVEWKSPRLGRWLWFVWLTVAGAGSAEQPIAFPHNTHMKMGLACVDCHIGADTYAAAGLPSVTKCMFCHAKLGRDKAEVKKVIEYANQKIEIPWQRVYRFEDSAHVLFKHAPHFRAGVHCATCHGDLTKAGVAEKVVNHNMGTCLTCHRQRNASQDCAACHF